jgi:hypothetical protein
MIILTFNFYYFLIEKFIQQIYIIIVDLVFVFVQIDEK